MMIEVTQDELLLIVNALTTGQFPIQQHNYVYRLVTRLRALLND